MNYDDSASLAVEIGQRMRSARLRVFGEGSQGHVARLMSVSGSDISRWETAVRTPSAVDFVRFSRAVGVAPEKLLAGIAPARSEQMTITGLDAPAAKVVKRLVYLLRERKAS
jgi:transcriptional regulator with XRE-family HTH domain